MNNLIFMNCELSHEVLFLTTAVITPVVYTPRTTVLQTELARAGQFTARLATTAQQLDAVFQLRFKVFNLELNEGLDSAYACGRDIDEFDSYCDHILVENAENGEAVGTYRMQTGTTANRGFGYYSEREFDFTPFQPLRSQIVELGRACVLREYRSYEVLALLWRAVAIYAMQQHARYLIGCSSVSSQDPAVAWSMYYRLAPKHEVEPKLRTVPTEAFCVPPIDGSIADQIRIPKLLRAYLAVGAKICGSPALDREFKTIDFLTLLDLETMSPAARMHFFK